MKEFFKFYKWGIEVKLYMSIYTIALLFTKCILELLMGGTVVSIWVIFEMIIIAFAASLIQRSCFPANAEFEKDRLIRRVILWAFLTNVLFIGAAVLLNWFPALPLWGSALLLLILEGGLYAMWVGFYFVQKLDTKQLNEKLNAYQKK